MKTEEEVHAMINRHKTKRNTYKKQGNDLKFQAECAVIRNLKIVLDIKPSMED